MRASTSRMMATCKVETLVVKIYEVINFIERSLFSRNHLFSAHPALFDAFPSCVLSSQCVRGCVLPLALDEDDDKEGHDDHGNDNYDHDKVG